MEERGVYPMGASWAVGKYLMAKEDKAYNDTLSDGEMNAYVNNKLNIK